MKVFIVADMEGTTGLERLEEIFRGLPGFDTFRQMMAGDANAVVQGAIEGGATEIVVSDSHGYMCNIYPDDLVPGVRLYRGQLRREWCQMKGFDEGYDAVIMIGFHAKSGTNDAILAHTWITGFRDVRINGHSVPEPSLNGYLAGAFGVPVVMLSGDDRVIEEARPVLGDIHYAQVKQSVGFFKGIHLPIDRSRQLLRETAKKAVQDAAKIPPIKCELPVTVEIDLSPDVVDDPALGCRLDDNLKYQELSLSKLATKNYSDVDIVLLTHPDVISTKRGTVSFTCKSYKEAYRKIYSILGVIYERDIENLIDDVSNPQEYSRPDLQNIIGDDYPLNEIGPRRKKSAA
ncbi:hypothetical protein AA2016_3964 [Aminobacter aminovorans]|nr:hypothetical protein AA2016_3964 [Aminobacter aminovorans]